MATLVEHIATVASTSTILASASSTSRATPQGGILEHGNPAHYDPKNPLIMFIIQAGIIIVFCRLLHYPLSLIRQPRVIAEVIGGILLGPSVMGRVPGFTAAIFPAASMPNLSLVANLGLVLFLFLVGLEVDFSLFMSNWKVALSVGAAGMALPFALGCAIAWGLFHEFRSDPGTVPISFSVYMLFVGVAMAITAFPVLCRILSELKLLQTPVGVTVLSAGVGNDVVGWILLALCVALVNAGSGLTALWVLLAAFGYALFLFIGVRPAFLWLLRRNGSLRDGPSQGIIMLTLLMVLASAFFTGVIGVHPIFGAFMIGLICPHDGGFAIKVTEKIEDLVSTVFLPLYFALSGLSTNLGLLNDGITWAYVVGIIAVAFSAKFTGGMLAAKLNGLVWRESATIGVLMSCKGLVELIVLNIGLQAKILSLRTFTMFVVMALVTTFATTPLTSLLYPTWYQEKIGAWKRGEIDWETGLPLHDGASDLDTGVSTKRDTTKIRSLVVYSRLDTMPTLLAFVSLLGIETTDRTESVHPELKGAPEPPRPEPTIAHSPVEVLGVRLMQLTERTSTVMRVTEANEYSANDPVINALRVLGQLCNLSVAGDVRVVPETTFADTLVSTAVENSSDLLLLPWSETGTMSESRPLHEDQGKQKLTSTEYVEFVSQTLRSMQANTAVFIPDKSFAGMLNQSTPGLRRTMSTLSARSHRDHVAFPSRRRGYHIFLPYFGGRDGRLALRLVLQLVQNRKVTATIAHFQFDRSAATEQHATQERSSTAQSDAAFFETMQVSLPEDFKSKVVFQTVETGTPLEDALARVPTKQHPDVTNGADIVVVGRDIDMFRDASANSSCLGATATKILENQCRVSLVVVQAKAEL